MGPLFFIAAGGTALAASTVLRTFWRERQPGVATLLYHRVRTPADYEALRGPERNFSVRTDRFEEQLDWLQSQGATFLDLEGIRAVRSGERPCPKNAVAITFDDGSRSVLTEAAPRLKARRIPATVFVTGSADAWIFDEEPRMTDLELAELVRMGFSVGAHGHSHHGLNELTDPNLAAELRESRATLEAALGRGVDTMAVPLNFYNQRVLDAAAAAGYQLVFTANPGRIRASDDPFTLRRVAVEGGMTLPTFVRSLDPLALGLRRVVHLLKRMPPKILGESRWMPIRSRLFHSPVGRYLTARHLTRALVVGSIVWAGCLVILVVSPV